MIAERIRVSPFFFEQITACEIKKEPNAHGLAYVKGYIPTAEEEKYLSLSAQETGVQIEAVSEEGESKIIFSGMIKECKIKHSNQLLEMELSLVTCTYLMDLQPRIRSFQEPGTAYQQIFDAVAGAYPKGGCILTERHAAVSEELIVQYQETDWAFLKRLASHLEMVIIPETQRPGAKAYAGFPQRSNLIEVNPVSYTVCKAVRDYLYKQVNQVEGLIEEDERYYEIQEQAVLELGERVEFGQKIYYVTSAKSWLDGHQLWNSYVIKPAGGLRVPKQYNEKIVGASLDGSITGIQGAQVKVKLSAEGIQGEGRWFPFSTVYSSPDGSGWYCMPEPGDEIRLYFPTVKEKHAYVISAVHLPVSQEPSASAASATASVQPMSAASGEYGAASAVSGGGSSVASASAASSGGSSVASAAAVSGGGSSVASASAVSGGGSSMASSAGNGTVPRSNPDCKTIRTVTGKTVELTPTRICLSNQQGLEIILDDQEGILIASNKNIRIRSEDAVSIAGGGGIDLMGMEKVQLRQQQASVELTESKLKLLGADVRMQ